MDIPISKNEVKQLTEDVLNDARDMIAEYDPDLTGPQRLGVLRRIIRQLQSRIEPAQANKE